MTYVIAITTLQDRFDCLYIECIYGPESGSNLFRVPHTSLPPCLSLTLESSTLALVSDIGLISIGGEPRATRLKPHLNQRFCLFPTESTQVFSLSLVGSD